MRLKPSGAPWGRGGAGAEPASRGRHWLAAVVFRVSEKHLKQPARGSESDPRWSSPGRALATWLLPACLLSSACRSLHSLSPDT